MNHSLILKKGAMEMTVFMKQARRGYILAIIFTVGMILGGCTATINSLYDPVADFSTIKTYRWAANDPYAQQNPLIKKNICYYADISLKNKGFTLTSDKPDFVISMDYETDYSVPYKVRKLNLYVYRMQDKEMIWRGTAIAGTFQSIQADTFSLELFKAVDEILMNFPPKR
jgi:hypothetical protein